MDESHSLLLNEEAFKACPDAKKPVFIYEWLRYLDRILPVTHKNDLRTVQVQLLQQLEARLASVTGPPTRQLLAKCIARVYVTGDSYSLFGTINACNDTLKNKEDSPSQLQAKFAALCCLGALYESVGRLVGRTYEDSIAICVKWLKSADSQGRAEIMSTLSSMITGLGSAASNKHKELYRAARDWVTDRVMTVRMAAVQCITALVPFYSPLYTTELESACTLCVKALEGSNYETRVAVAKLFSALIANAIQPPPGATMVSRSGPIPIVPQALDDCLHLLSTAFLRGGIGGFLRTTSGSTATAGGHREIRVGVSMGYVELIREMGVSWLERNLGAVCKHLLELASKGGVLAYTTNQAQASEAVVIRRCVSYILRATVGEMLSENSQMTACKYLGSLLADYINSFDCTTDGVDRVLEGDAYASGFAASAALLEISALVRQIGTAVTPLFVEASGIMEPVFACLLHPVPSARAATAWCLRCITLAVPSQLTPLIDRCISRLEHMRASSDAISGYSLALAALIAAAADCKLGIPHAKPKQVLQCAEDMLRTASQQSRLAVAKINAGWILLHALVSLGPSVMKDHIPKVSQLWRVAFPRSVKEAQAEKDRGDAFSWQCSLEARAGALAVMAAVAEQKDLCDDETIKSMLLPVECAVVNMGQVGALIRSYGNKMRSMICVVRIRVYGLLMLLPSKSCENFFGPLMSELVADLTLSDNVQSTLMTSQAASMCTSAEHTLLFPWHDATDQSMIENQLQPEPGRRSDALTGLQCQSGSVCSFENDFNCIVSGSAKDIHDMWPEPDSPQSACLDAAVHAYGKILSEIFMMLQIFPLVASKHKQQITAHFMEVIKNSSRVGPRQAAIQLNVLCALAGACRTICEHRGAKIDNEQLKTTSFSLIVAGLVSANPLTRCVAAEAMGRLSQAVGDPQYVASMAQHCFDRLNVKNSRDANGRAGYVLALGCLHRHVGSLGSGQHLHTGVSIMLALAQDNTTPLVQAWSLVSLALIAETGGGMFRGYVEPVLSACLSLLLNTLATNVEVVQGIGKLLSALMTYVGPDLASHGPIDALRGSLLAACAIQLAHPDPLVKAEAIAGLQQMHLYAPRYVDINHLVVDIATFLTSSHLCLRKAAVCCLRQLVQREAKEVREHAQVLVPQGVVDEGKKLPLPDTGLEGALFGMLDAETHPALRSHVQETLISLVQATCGELLNHWLSLCKDILATSSDNTRSTLIVEDKKEKEADDDEEGGDDDATLQGAKGPVVVDKGKLQPRWPTRVFATQIVQRLMSVCDTERAHLDLALAKELQMSSGGRADYLVLHLSDLVRMSFMGATSDNTELRLAGLLSLQDVINRFSAVPEPEFPGHVILEQFQAQVGAALRPAFTEDTPSHVTAAACQVCSTWIGSGVARDLNDLRRVHQLLVSSLGKLKHGSINTQLYSESAATLEKMSILKAWAEVYVTGIEQERREDERRRDKETTTTDSDDIDAPSESLLSLVKPELNSLVCFWLAALRDWALLSLPSVLSDQLPPNGGAFYKSESAEVCREYYRNSWPPLLLASSIWLNQTNFKLPDSKEAPETWPDNTAESRFHLMVGIAVDALCSRTTYIDDATIQTCVRAITALLSCEWCQLQLMTDVRLSIELCNVLHRLILTRDSLTTQQLCVDCARSVLDAAKCAMRLSSSADMENGNLPASTPSTPLAASVFKGGEGTADGIAPATTLTFAMMELCLCLMVRQMPQINSAQMKSKSLAPLHLRRFGRLPADSANLIRSGIQLLVQVPSLCSPEGRLVVLPVILYLVIGFVRESARIDESSVVPDLPPGHLTLVATTSIQALRTIASTPPTDSTLTQWTTIIRSALYSMLLLTEGDAAMDHCVLMLACVVMASVAPRSVVLGHPPSFHRLIRLIKSQLVSEHHQVVSKTVQSVTSLFARRDACGPFVKHLGVEVFDIIRPLVTGQNVEQRVKDISEEYLPVVQDTIKAIEVLVSTSDEKKKLSLVSLVTQALCRLICASNADEWRHLSPAARRLHDFAIARLNTIAPTWPHLFKQVLAAHPDVKKRLEGALMFQSSRQTQAQQAAKAKAMENKNSMTAQPKIKLTMDFNAFGKVSS